MRCTVGGVELFCDAADAAVTPGLLSGQYEAHLSAVFEKYCTSGMTVVDVGANLGYYSLLASKLVGRPAACVALEPNSENCRLLLSSLRLQRHHECRAAAGGGRHGRRVGLLLDARRLQRRADRRRGPPVAPGHGRPDLPPRRPGGGPGGIPEDGRRRGRGPGGGGRPRTHRPRPAHRHHRAEGRDAAPGVGHHGRRIPRVLREAGLHAVAPGEGRPARRRRTAPWPSCSADWGETDELRDVLLLPGPA